MLTVSITEAKTQLSKLIKKTLAGESFIIAKAGKPLVKVIPYGTVEPKETGLLGCMKGEYSFAPDFDIKAFARDEVIAMFEADEDKALYNVALEVERDAALATEMREWREGLARDGIRGTEYGSGEHNAAR